MKTAIKRAKGFDAIEAVANGPLMVYRPMSAQEEKDLCDFVARRKALHKAKKPKTLLQKIFS